MKRTSLKHIHTLAAHVALDLEDLFKKSSALSDSRRMEYGLSQAIWDTTERWRDNYWYDGVIGDAVSNYGANADAVLEGMGLDPARYLDPDSDEHDDDILDQYKTDVTNAYCDACHQAEEAEFHRLVMRDVEDAITDVAPYYCLLALRDKKLVETEHLYEATRIVFGFTRKWHQDWVAQSNDWYARLPVGNPSRGFKFTYDPGDIADDAESAVEDIRRTIDTDYRIQECADDKNFAEIFSDMAECASMMADSDAARLEGLCHESLEQMEAIAHAGWVRRTTERMGVRS